MKPQKKEKSEFVGGAKPSAAMGSAMDELVDKVLAYKPKRAARKPQIRKKRIQG